MQLMFWLMFSFLLVLLTKDICVYQFNTMYGLNLLQDSSLSTALSRTITLGTICKTNEIRHLYATLPQNGATAVFFNLHTGTNLDFFTLKLSLAGSAVATKNSTSPYHLQDVQQIGQRMIHSVLFDNLNAQTTYSLEVSDKTGTVLATTTYRTLPAANSSSLKIAVGGDVGLTKQGQMMTSRLAAFDPDVIVIGGDIAYDDGMRTCYYSWDNFYDMLKAKPHYSDDIVCFDALSEVPVDRHPDRTPLYFLYHPQNSGKDPSVVPVYTQRDTVHYHIMGPVLMFNLDSGYMRKYDEQKQTMRKVAADYPGYYRVANYHNPIYPSCADSKKDSNYQKVVAQGLLHWVPTFDQLSQTTVMEHHTHFRKMTYRLRNDSIDSSNGVRYIGDGSWGVPDKQCPYNVSTQRTDIMQNFTQSNPNHMWQVTFTKTNSATQPYTLNYTSVDVYGNLILTKVDLLSTPPT